jgi:ATP/maltotriose-dependent transcriptional regulator MalT
MASPEREGQVELASALVMIEAGYPARVAGALERAEAAPGHHEEPMSRALSQVLHAQMLLLDGMSAAAVRASLEGLGSLPPDTAGSPLAVYAHLTAAECLLASGDVAGAAVYLERIGGSPGRTGLLAARVEVLQVRIALARGAPGLEAIRALLDKALSRLERLGAWRDLALAYDLRPCRRS